MSISCTAVINHLMYIVTVFHLKTGIRGLINYGRPM